MSASQLSPPVGPQDHVDGPHEGPLTLLEYGDFECPHCGRAHPIIKAVQRALGKQLRFVFRHFPLKEIHPHAFHAAEAAESAGAQGKFWEMHDLIFENQHALEDADLLRYAKSLRLDTERIAQDLAAGTYTKKVRDDFRSGVRSGVNGTPTFFVNGQRFDGIWADERRFIAALREALPASVP